MCFSFSHKKHKKQQNPQSFPEVQAHMIIFCQFRTILNCFSSFWNIVSPICTTTRNSHSPFVLSLWYSRRAKSVLCKYHNTNCFKGKFLNQKHSVAECHRIFHKSSHLSHASVQNLQCKKSKFKSTPNSRSFNKVSYPENKYNT